MIARANRTGTRDATQAVSFAPERAVHSDWAGYRAAGNGANLTSSDRSQPGDECRSATDGGGGHRHAARQRRAAHACGAPWEPTVRAADRSRRFRWQQDISCERVSPLAAQFGWCPLPHVTCEPECVKAADQQVAGIQSAIQCSVAGRREVRVVAVVPALPNATIAMAQLLRLWFRVPWCPCRIDADCHCGTRAERLDYPAAGRARRDHGAASGGLRRRPLGMRPRLRPGVRCARWDEHTACRSLRLRDFTLMRLDQTQSHVRLSCDADDGVAYDA